ncbi:MAG: hypothetical protein K2X50_07285 [Gammaproteobacteria bacterium]|nr:hypothetical protein [Gammaproteobacteria bacterium]
MSPFADKVRKLIAQYKQILKRHLPARSFSAKINTLQIKRTQLKHASDIDLYYTIDRILYEIDSWHSNKDMASSEYSGLDEFRDHIKNTIQNYALKDNKVINRCQHASRTLVESIQLLNMPQNEKTIEKLKSNIAHLRQHGHEEELQQLSHALQKMKISNLHGNYNNSHFANDFDFEFIDKDAQLYHTAQNSKYE